MKHDTDLLPVVRAAHLEELRDERRWLVESLWARSGVGIIGGAPKCCKSWLGLDMALSIASATPCLATFPVVEPGGVLLYMAEDSAAVVKSRLAGLCIFRSSLGTASGAPPRLRGGAASRRWTPPCCACSARRMRR
jgi:RecA-family ATPase